jgi:hypothetical protein
MFSKFNSKMFSKFNSKMFSKINNKLTSYINYKFLAPFVGTTYAIYHCSVYQFKQFSINEYKKIIEYEKDIDELDSFYDFMSKISIEIPSQFSETSKENNEIIKCFKKDVKSLKYFMYSKRNETITNYVISIFFFNIMTQVICKIPIISLPYFTTLFIYKSFTNDDE